MKSFKLILCDGTPIELNKPSEPQVNAYLARPEAQTSEMIRQINSANYYRELFYQRQGLQFLDLGANIGLVSLYAMPACSRVLAIEPSPPVFRVLASLCDPYSAKVKCCNTALSPITGPVNLFLDPRDYSCNRLVGPSNPNSIPVSGKTFETILDTFAMAPDVCKVDVEGAEMESFSTSTIADSGVKIFYMEVHKDARHDRNENVVRMTKRFREAGYGIELLRQNAIIATKK